MMTPNTRLRLPSGRYSSLGRKRQAPVAAAAVTAATTANDRKRLRTMPRMKAMISSTKPRASWSMPGSGRRLKVSLPSARRLPPSTRLESAGITVIETTSDSSTETEIATAMSRNNCPTSSFMTRIGMNTMTVVSAETSTAPQTCLAPR